MLQVDDITAGYATVKITTAQIQHSIVYIYTCSELAPMVVLEFSGVFSRVQPLWVPGE